MKILLVDDHPLFREGVRQTLELLFADEGPVEILEAGSAKEACALNDQQIDLVLLDLEMPGTHGQQSFDTIASAFEGAQLVVVSSSDSVDLIRSTIESGASAFIPKTSSSKVLTAALGLVTSGGVYLPPSVLRYVKTDEPARSTGEPVEASVATNETPAPSSFYEDGVGLTKRQLEVLKAVVRGGSNKHIAREMNISEGTVKAHLSTAYRVLGVKTRTQAVLAIAEHGYPQMIGDVSEPDSSD